MPSIVDRDGISYGDLPDAAELFSPAAATAEGWQVPVGGQLVSYLYFHPTEFAFEIWLGGDNNVTVKIEQPFTLREGKRSLSLDPRTTRKSDLTPLLDISVLKVASVLVRRSGRLEVEFAGDWKLAVDPAPEGRAWLMGWPDEGPSTVACAAGGDIRVNSPDEPWIHPSLSDEVFDLEPVWVEPVRQGSSTALPIRGLISEAAASADSIELVVPIASGDRFDMHFRGTVRITGGQNGDWTGEARGPVLLGLVGASVTRSQMVAGERLYLELNDGRLLIAEPDTWEAHWPAAASSLDDIWVPREGPSIP